MASVYKNRNKKSHFTPYIPPVGRSAFSMDDAGRLLDALRPSLPEGAFPNSPGSPSTGSTHSPQPQAQQSGPPTAFLTCGYAGEGYEVLQCGGIMHHDKTVELTCVGRPPEGQARIKRVPYWMDRRSADKTLGETQIRLNLIRTPAGVLCQVTPVRGAGGRMFRGLPSFHPDSRTIHVRLVSEFVGCDMPAPGQPTPLTGDPLDFDASGLTAAQLKGFPLPIRNVISELEVSRVNNRTQVAVVRDTDPLNEAFEEVEGELAEAGWGVVRETDVEAEVPLEVDA